MIKTVPVKTTAYLYSSVRKRKHDYHHGDAAVFHRNHNNDRTSGHFCLGKGGVLFLLNLTVFKSFKLIICSHNYYFKYITNRNKNEGIDSLKHLATHCCEPDWYFF